MANNFLTLVKKLIESSKKPLSTTGDPNASQVTLKPRIATPWLDTRQRTVTAPPTPQERLQEEAAYLAGGEDRIRGGAIATKAPRWKAALLGALNAMGQNAQIAMQSGNVGWGGVAQALGGGVGGAAMGATFGPGLILKARHQQAIDENQAEQDQLLQQEANQAQLDNLRALAAQRQAQAEYSKQRPDIEARSQDLRERDIARRQAYQDRSLELREEALNDRISLSEWKKQQKELDRDFGYDRLEETQRHNLATEKQADANLQSRERIAGANRSAREKTVEQRRAVKASEAQIREAARSAGLDPNIAVERARARGIL